MPNYLFAPNAELPVIGRARRDRRYVPVRPGTDRGLGKGRFHDWRPRSTDFAYPPNVDLLRKQIEVLAEMLAAPPPTPRSRRTSTSPSESDSCSRVVPYAQLILEEALLSGVDERAARRDLRRAGARLQQLRRRAGRQARHERRAAASRCG